VKISSELPADVARQSIMGHSMGGHGALTIALRNQGRYASVSAFSPICSPGVPLTLRMHEGYDHSYFFISTFIEDHLRRHARRLGIATAR
jgi:S-formylglutathione hydrolase FrmB